MRVVVQFEFDDSESFIVDALDQIAARKKNGKRGRRKARVNDNKLVKKLHAKKGCAKVELVRVHCCSGYGTPLMAVKAVYRSYFKDGTVRETLGQKHFFEQGQLSYKKWSGETTQSSKIFFERDGIVVNVQDATGTRGKVSPSMRMFFLKC